MITWNHLFFHAPVTYMIELVVSMHDYVIIFLFSVIILVFFSLAKVFFTKIFRMEFFEDHQLETVWTIAPFFLLTLILIPSLTSLYMLDTCNFCGFSVRIIGHQWYWNYEYKELRNLSFDSYMLDNSSRKFRLLDVDNRLLVPSLIPTRFVVRRADVIHSWTIPSFGFKMDAVPGRINQFCVAPKRTGVFFGQCSEICGANHSFIPIVIESLRLKNIVKLFWMDSL